MVRFPILAPVGRARSHCCAHGGPVDRVGDLAELKCPVKCFTDISVHVGALLMWTGTGGTTAHTQSTGHCGTTPFDTAGSVGRTQFYSLIQHNYTRVALMEPRAERVYASAVIAKADVEAVAGSNTTVRALRTRDAPAADSDEWRCGADNDASPAELRLHVAIVGAADRLEMTGTFLSVVRDWTVTGCTMSGQWVGIPMTKQQGTLSSKSLAPLLLNHSFPLEIHLHCCWFASLARTALRTRHVVRVHFDRPAVSLCVPAPFAKPTGLAGRCLNLMVFGNRNSELSDVVQFDLTLASLVRVMTALVKDRKTAVDRKRHLWTLYCCFTAFGKFIESRAVLPDLNLLLQCVYTPVAGNIGALVESFRGPQLGSDEFAAVASPDVLHCVAKPFSGAFANWVLAEAVNMLFLSGTVSNVAPIVCEAVQAVLDTTVTTDVLRRVLPLLSCVVVKELRVTHLNLAAAQTGAQLRPNEIVRGDNVTVDAVLFSYDCGRRAQCLAFAMGRHARLGAQSSVRLLPKDIIKLICAKLSRDNEAAIGAPLSGTLVPRDVVGGALAIESRDAAAVMYRSARSKFLSWHSSDIEAHPHVRRLCVSFRVEPIFSFPSMMSLPLPLIAHILGFVPAATVMCFMLCSKETYSTVVHSRAFYLWYRKRVGQAQCDRWKAPGLELRRFDRDPDTEGIEMDRMWDQTAAYIEAARSVTRETRSLLHPYNPYVYSGGKVLRRAFDPDIPAFTPESRQRKREILSAEMASADAAVEKLRAARLAGTAGYPDDHLCAIQ